MTCSRDSPQDDFNTDKPQTWVSSCWEWAVPSSIYCGKNSKPFGFRMPDIKCTFTKSKLWDDVSCFLYLSCWQLRALLRLSLFTLPNSSWIRMFLWEDPGWFAPIPHPLGTGQPALEGQVPHLDKNCRLQEVVQLLKNGLCLVEMFYFSHSN